MHFCKRVVVNSPFRVYVNGYSENNDQMNNIKIKGYDIPNAVGILNGIAPEKGDC
jgi:hypothetical protein